MSEPANLLSDPIQFWEQRHRKLDPWRSGGDRGLSEAENYEFYLYRMGRIIELMRKYSNDRPLQILDAGCGRGHTTDHLKKCGHAVVGIDSSATAIELATKDYGNHFQCAELWNHRPEAPYDVILCLDVLFHILDDEAWQKSLTAFAHYAAAESILIITDAFFEERFQLGNYIVHRSRSEYVSHLEALDYRLAEISPYHFGANPNGFAVFLRGVE
jgi:SAM-dependent methyltransferase